MDIGVTSQGATWVVVRMTTRVMASRALTDLPTSSTVLTVLARASSERVTAIAAVPEAEPSRPASTVPAPCWARPPENRATVAP